MGSDSYERIYMELMFQWYPLEPEQIPIHFRQVRRQNEKNPMKGDDLAW